MTLPSPLSYARRRVAGRPFVGAIVAILMLAAPAGRAQTQRSEMSGDTAAVAAGRTFTVEAGATLIAEGGTAIDAGVAAIFAAAVVEISHFGLGGEAPIALYHAKTGDVVVINGQGPAPAAADPRLFAGASAIPCNGPLGATIPAVVDAAALALERYGTKSLADVLAPAIGLADGFPMYEFLHRYLVSERAACEPFQDTMATYYPGGRVTPTGEVFRQPNLAATLRRLVAAERAALEAGATREAAIRAGRDAFYTGDIAARIAAAVQQAGGVMTADDLARYEG
ncbi:MAG: gamma-glutamyltransferase, partial [Vicinamibacteria bacterium]